MIHPDTELRPVSDAGGNGVYANRPIPRGTIVYVTDDAEIFRSPLQLGGFRAAHTLRFGQAGYGDHAGNRAVSSHHAKYVNHRCDPDPLGSGCGFGIAVRDIAAGEEITDRHGLFGPDRPGAVGCGRRNCRGVQLPDDPGHNAGQPDAVLVAALAHAGHVRQPLLEYMNRHLLGRLQEFLYGNRPYFPAGNLRRHGRAVSGMTAR